MKGYFVLDSNRMVWLQTSYEGQLRSFVFDVKQATRFSSYWAAEKACKLTNQFPVYVEPDSLIGRVRMALKMRKIRKANILRAAASRGIR